MSYGINTFFLFLLLFLKIIAQLINVTKQIINKRIEEPILSPVIGTFVSLGVFPLSGTGAVSSSKTISTYTSLFGITTE
jgi:hypothetical protein